MKRAYRWLADLIAVGVVVQVAAIAGGAFGAFHAVDHSGSITDKYENAGLDVHFFVGMMIIPLLTIAFLIVSLLAKIPEGKRWGGYLFGAVALQIVLAGIAFGVPAVGPLHGLNALVILTLALLAGRKARAAIAGDAPAATADVPAARTSAEQGSKASARQV